MATENDEQLHSETIIQSLLDIATEAWRVGRLFERLLVEQDANKQDKYRAQFRWFQKKVESSLASLGMRIENIEGHPFDTGVAATPLNIEEFDRDDKLVIDQMLEPIIMSSTGVVRTGTVILKKISESGEE